MAITAQEFSLLLEPKISNIWHDEMASEDEVYTKLFNVRDMDKATITDMQLAGFGPLQNQDDGGELAYLDPIAPQTKAYTYSVRAGGYKVQDRIWRYDLYGEVERFERDLMDSAKDDVETTAAGIFNNAFATTNVGFDGLALCSTSHTRLDGGTAQANRSATEGALSLAGLQAALITIDKWKNENGRPRTWTPERLVIPSDLIHVAAELTESQLKPGTANNDKNVITRFNLDVVRWKYITSTTAWFVQCNKHDLNFFWAFRPETGMEVDFDTDTIKRKVRQGRGVGFGKWNGIFGDDGVA
jgi:hypothetical protein